MGFKIQVFRENENREKNKIRCRSNYNDWLINLILF